MSRQGALSDKFPVIRKNHQDPSSGIDNLRALDKLTVKVPKDLAAAYDPRPSRKGVRRLSHPAKQRTPQLLLHGKEEDHMAFTHAFVGGQSLSGGK